MLWKGRRQSDNIQDARGGGGPGMPGGFGRRPINIPVGRGGGGLSFSTLIILVVLFFALRACGIDPLQILAGGDSGAPGGGGQVTEGAPPTGSDEMTQFVATVLAETEDVWKGVFQAEGRTYEEPKLVLFSGQISSACGFASSASGPFYCPGDRKVYLDMSFFNQMARQFKAAGDFAQAYGRHRGGAERRPADRRRHAAEADAGLCGAGKLQPRHVGAASALAGGRDEERTAVGLRHVQQPDLRTWRVAAVLSGSLLERTDGLEVRSQEGRTKLL